MTKRSKRGIWRIIPVLLVTILAQTETAFSGTGKPGSQKELFRDIARDSGIDFVHFNGMSGEYYICEVKCAGAGLFDYDNDGDLDVYLLQGSMLGPGKTLADAKYPPRNLEPPRDRLFRNDLTVHPDGTRTLKFTDVTETSGIVAPHFGIGVAAGDYDNDGDLDLYVSNFGPSQMYRNNGDGTFTDVTRQAGTSDPRYNASAAFVDFDRDGWLDLFVCAYINFNYATHRKCYTHSGEQDYCGPMSFDILPDRLYRNRGDGTFEDVSAKAQITQEYGSALGVVCADLNGDGWIDIYVANDARPNQLWLNRRDGTFQNEALLGGCALNADGHPEAGMGVDAGDFDADGDDDLFMTHLRGETNTIYVNDGTGLFEDRSNETGLGLHSMAYTTFGAAWFDYDNDGWLDILVANGAVNKIEALARAGDPHPFHQPNQLFKNLGNGRFEEVTKSAGSVFKLSEVSRGTAFGDVDNDGDTDVLIINNCGPPRLLINQVGNQNHWMGLRLMDEHKKRDLLGARVGVFRSQGPTLWRNVRSAASYCSANDPRVLVGLGDTTKPTKIQVRWPNGQWEQWKNVPIDTYSTLRQGNGTEVKN
jgi:enediyne biosynthesis protein E4